MEIADATAIAASQAGSSQRNLPFPITAPSISLRTVFGEFTPTAMAVAAIVTGICCCAPFAMEIVKASTPVRPKTAPDQSKPVCPNRCVPHKPRRGRLKKHCHFQCRDDLEDCAIPPLGSFSPSLHPIKNMMLRSKWGREIRHKRQSRELV